jgi:hypothetical protein
MEARREDLGLWTVLAVHGDDAAFRERPPTVDAEELPQVAIGYTHERGRRDCEQDCQDAYYAQCTVHETIPKLLRQQGGTEERDDGSQHHTQ